MPFARASAPLPTSHLSSNQALTWFWKVKYRCARQTQNTIQVLDSEIKSQNALITPVDPWSGHANPDPLIAHRPLSLGSMARYQYIFHANGDISSDINTSDSSKR
jgi:hypothetical protein